MSNSVVASNTWLKLAVVSIVGIVLIYVALWGFNTFNNSYGYGNMGYYNGNYQYNGMTGMNGNMNIQGGMNNMQGNMNMGGKMQGGMGMH